MLRLTAMFFCMILPLGVVGVDAHAPSSREDTIVRLGIERDLSKLSPAHYRAWSAEEDCEANADASFEKAMQEASLDSELTAEERAEFKKNFIQEMLDDCAADPEIATNWEADVATALEHEKPAVTEALVKNINDENQGWTAKVDEERLPMWRLMAKCGKKDDPDAPSEHLDLDTEENLALIDEGTVEANYNAAEKVPACKEVIMKMHNQGTCGSCWAFGTLSAIDSRLCMVSNGAFSGGRAVLSRGHCTSCGYQGRDGCQGGNFPAVYKILAGDGLPLGSSNPKGCMPYFGSGSGQDHFNSKSKAPPCASSCVNQDPPYPRGMAEDKLKIPGYSGREYGPYQKDPYEKAEKFSRTEMYKNGPLPIAVMVDSRFQSYSSGVYKNGCNSKNANHVTVAYGYTPDYFETMNSWGPGWGDRGHMKMANCEIAEWSVPSGTKLGSYTLPGGNAPPSPAPGPGPAPPAPGPPAPPCPPGMDCWSLDANGNWVRPGR